MDNYSRSVSNISFLHQTYSCDAELEPRLSEYLSNAKTIRQFIRNISNVLRPLGITDFAHACLNHASGTLDPVGTYDDTMTDRFAKEGFHHWDLATQHLLTTRTAIFRNHIDKYIETTPFEHEMFRQHREVSKFMGTLGMYDVYNLPLPDADYLGLFSISSHNCPPEKFQEIVQRHLPKIQLLGRLVDAIGREKFNKSFHNPNHNPRMPISMKHLRFLQTLAAKRCNLREASATCGIESKTGESWMAALKEVFGEATIHGVVIAAHREGLITYD